MATPFTTLVPFSTLPSCATQCYHLYDANGACVPSTTATQTIQYASCFCNNALVMPFSTGTSGVCDQACTAAGETGGLESIHLWFSSFCSANQNQLATATSGSSSTSTGSSSSKSNSDHYNWLNSHWQWVIFIVVMVVGIAAVWIGACLWHRRYLRKKDRQYALRNIRASTGAASGTTGLNNPSMPDFVGQTDVAGVFAAGTAEPAYDTEKRRSTLLSRRR